MKNHFFIPYFGNKRQEVEQIFNFIEHKLDDIKIIVEPFCGSSALSYYLSTKYPKKFTYILNDNNDMIFKLYNLSGNELLKLRNDLVAFHKTIKCKEDYDREIIGWEKDLVKYIYANKVYSIRPALYPIGKVFNDSSFDVIINAPIIDFLRNEDVRIFNNDALEIYNKYKDNKEAMIFLDPPYLGTDNRWYKSPTSSIYEYLYDNDIILNNAYIVLCLANMWIIKLLFKNKKSLEYDKRYETTKKELKHIIISNEK